MKDVLKKSIQCYVDMGLSGAKPMKTEASRAQVRALAAAVLLALPIILAYSIFQRHFIQSMASTGLKG